MLKLSPELWLLAWKPALPVTPSPSFPSLSIKSQVVNTQREQEMTNFTETATDTYKYERLLPTFYSGDWAVYCKSLSLHKFLLKTNQSNKPWNG